MNNDSSSQEVKQNRLRAFAEFEARFPTEMDCLDELYRLARIEKRCRICHGELEMDEGGRRGACLPCRRDTWLTAGTFFDHIKKPRARLAVIWLAKHGLVVNATTFSELLKIAYASAHGILNWLRFAQQYCMPEDTSQIDSACFKSVFAKRSRETPEREPPVAEQEQAERSAETCQTYRHSKKVALLASDDDVRQSTASSDSDREDESQSDEFCRQKESVYGLVSDSEIHFDELVEQSKLPVGTVSGVLSILEMEGKVRRQTGDWYVRLITKPKRDAPGPEISRGIDSCLAFIEKHFRGISRRYLQHYLASYWCYIDRSRWSQDETWQSCLGSLAAASRQIRNYVTPLQVKFWTQNNLGNLAPLPSAK